MSDNYIALLVVQVFLTSQILVENNVHIYCPITKGILKIRTIHLDLILNPRRARLPNHPLDIWKSILAINIIFVSGIPFLVTISRDIRFEMAIALQNQYKKSIMKSLVNTINKYKVRGFSVQTMPGDGQFECLANIISNMAYLSIIPPTMNMYLKFKSYIITVNELNRATLNSLPFKLMTTHIIIEAVYINIFWLNAIPPRITHHETVSPINILTGIKLDVKQHWKTEFGSYVHSPSYRQRAGRTVFLHPQYWAQNQQIQLKRPPNAWRCDI